MSEKTLSRIKDANRAEFNVLKQVVAPEVLYERVPRLASVAEARVEHKNMTQTLMKLGAGGTTGFDPTRKFQYVANIDQSVWNIILEMFAKHDEEGKLMDDGLLYITDKRGNIVMNKPFFYALLEVLESAGYDVDMRGKVKLN